MTVPNLMSKAFSYQDLRKKPRAHRFNMFFDFSFSLRFAALIFRLFLLAFNIFQSVFVKFCPNYKGIFMSGNLRKKVSFSIYFNKGTEFHRYCGYFA